MRDNGIWWLLGLGGLVAIVLGAKNATANPVPPGEPPPPPPPPGAPPAQPPTQPPLTGAPNGGVTTPTNPGAGYTETYPTLPPGPTQGGGGWVQAPMVYQQPRRYWNGQAWIWY